MQIFKNASIQWKLHFLTVFAILIALTLSSAVFLMQSIRGFRVSKLKQVTALAKVLGANVNAAIEFNDKATAEDILSSLAVQPSIEVAAVYDQEGRLFATFPRKCPNPQDLPYSPAEGASFKNGYLEVVRPIQPMDQAFGLKSAESSRIGSIYLRTDLSEITSKTRQHSITMLAVFVVALAVSMVAARAILLRITKPIKSLVDAAERIKQGGSIQHRARKFAEDEHGVLCDAFNEMLDQIEVGQNEIRKANDELELRVEQRTADLQKATEEAQAASRAKSDFLANMSHEIRTPMTAILGYADLMASEGHLTRVGTQYLDVIRRNGSHLLALINDILDVSKVEAGKFETEKIVCSVGKLMVDLMSLHRTSALEKKISLELEYKTPIPASISTDPTRLHQILTNLISNAIKFTDQGGVRIEVQFLDDSEKPQLRFDVIDSGCGIPSDKLDRIFAAFTQSDETMSRRYGGTGLGLTISLGLAKLLGGDIDVSSEEGKGSCFRLRIDTGDVSRVEKVDGCREIFMPSKERAKVVARDTDRLDDLSVLLVEDGKDNQRLIRFLLEKVGAKVEVAENGKEGMDKALAANDLKTPFDVILMDMQMPVMDGYTAATKLRQLNYHLPIVALTAHAMSHDRQKCIDAGCDDYATKPIDRTKLIETILAQVSATTSPIEALSSPAIS